MCYACQTASKTFLVENCGSRPPPLKENQIEQKVPSGSLLLPKTPHPIADIRLRSVKTFRKLRVPNVVRVFSLIVSMNMYDDVIFQAAGDQDLAVKFLVMAAEVAISCGDPTEAQLACAAVTQAVDDSGASGHLTLLDQV